MKLFCIWGETKADVLAGYDAVALFEEPPQRVTWRLTSSFNGKRVGAECYAPNNPEIRAAYGEKIPQVEQAAVQDKPKKKKSKQKDVSE